MTNGNSMISIYNGIFDTTGQHKISVLDALARIKTGRSEKKIIELRNEADENRQKDLKEKLPSVCFSGTFSVRNDESLISHSGFICLDFDHVNPIEHKEMFSKWDYTYATWISPRGNGVKVLVKVADGKKHREHFAALQKIYPDTDVKCANPSRVCFESYDPEIYINEESKIFTDYIKFEVTSKVETSTNFETYKKLIKWLENKGNLFASGNRNQYVFVLAGAMCRYGISQDETLQLLQSDYTEQSFPAKEIFNSVRSAYKKNIGKEGSCEFSNEKFSSKETKHEINPKVFNEGFKPDDVIYGSDVYEGAVDIFENGYKAAETTHIPKLDEYFKFKRGELTLLTGIGNYGKSTYFTQLMVIKSYLMGYKWAVFSPENNPPHEYYFDLTEILLGCRCDAGAYKKPSRKAFDEAYKFISEHFFYVYPAELAPTPELIKTKFLELIIKEKVDGVSIDPFNQLSNDYAAKGGRSDKYLETFLSDCLRFATINNVFFLLIAHPHKLNKGGMTDYPCPDVYEISDGAMWSNKCDNILVYHRPLAQSDPMNPKCEHHSKKIRRQKQIGKKGMFEFELNIHKRRFYFDGFNPLDGNRFEQNVGVQTDIYNPTIKTPNYEGTRDFTESNKRIIEPPPF